VGEDLDELAIDDRVAKAVSGLVSRIEDRGLGPFLDSDARAKLYDMVREKGDKSTRRWAFQEMKPLHNFHKLLSWVTRKGWDHLLYPDARAKLYDMVRTESYRDAKQYVIREMKSVRDLLATDPIITHFGLEWLPNNDYVRQSIRDYEWKLLKSGEVADGDVHDMFQAIVAARAKLRAGVHETFNYATFNYTAFREGFGLNGGKKMFPSPIFGRTLELHEAR